jgi:hypothetical protein
MKFRQIRCKDSVNIKILKFNGKRFQFFVEENKDAKGSNGNLISKYKTGSTI